MTETENAATENAATETAPAAETNAGTETAPAAEVTAPPDESKVENLAKVCHQANKAYCESHGDTSQPEWSDAPEWQKKSAINGVKFHLENPDSKPEDSHNNWLKEKAADGWVYGTVKNPDTREHPCMLPYDKLPEQQKKKDALFIAIVRALA